MLTKLSTYAAIALYEICVRYRDNPGGVTSRKPVAWWTDALSNVPGGDRREWRKFKNERVKGAMAEINEETDLAIELIEHKQGRVVQEVQFAVRKRPRERARAVEEAPVDANLAMRAETLGIREIKLDGLVKEFGEALVRDKLNALEQRLANGNLRRIDNAYSYLRSLLRNGDVSETGAPAAEPNVGPAPSPSPAPPTNQGSWLGQRVRELRAEVERLDPQRRQFFVDHALQDLAAKGLLSAVISRRAAQGDVLHGPLGQKVVQAYALATYGAGWNVGPDQ